MKESLITGRLQYYINSARALFLAAELTHVSSTLFPAHTFLILILQTASYTHTHTHTCWLTLISGGCGVLRSIRVLHTKLKRPGTRSKRLEPDPEPADHLNYRPEPVRVPGRVLGSRVLREDLYFKPFQEVSYDNIYLYCNGNRHHLFHCIEYYGMIFRTILK